MMINELKEKLKNLFTFRHSECDEEELFIVQPKSQVVHLEISRVCNVNCIMCVKETPYWMALKDKKKFLDFEIFKKIFEDRKGIKFLNFVGAGEVFVSKDFVNILNYCFDKGFSSLGCITNLQLISEEMVKLMVKNNFHQITVSMDGCTKDTFEYIRRGSSFETTIRTMDLFQKFKKKYNSVFPHFTFSTVAMNSNIHELQGIVQLANKYGVRHINVARLWVTKEDILNESLFFNQEKYNRHYDQIVGLCEEFGIKIELPPKFGLPPTEKGNKVRQCKIPFESMFIDADGIVYPCVCRSEPDVFIGSICEDSLSDIWNTEKFNNFRKAMFSESPPKQCMECTFSVLDPNKIESHMTPELVKKVKSRESDKV